MTSQADKDKVPLTHAREFTINPFTFHVLPCDINRFCIVILSSNDSPVLKNLLQFILNSYAEENVVISGQSDLHVVKKEFTDYSQTTDQLKKKIAILDLSSDNQFKHIHPNIIPSAYPELLQSPSMNYNGTKWLYNHLIKNILIPNILLQNGNPHGDWCKNYSHTVWLASSLEQIPTVLWNNFHMIFITEPNHIKECVKKKLGSDHIMKDDIIFVMSSTLKSNIQLMILPKDRFK